MNKSFNDAQAMKQSLAVESKRIKIYHPLQAISSREKLLAIMHERHLNEQYAMEHSENNSVTATPLILKQLSSRIGINNLGQSLMEHMEFLNQAKLGQQKEKKVNAGIESPSGVQNILQVNLNTNNRLD